MLSPEITEALEKALAAVLDEIGDSPEYEALAGHLEAARDAMQDLPAKDDAEEAPAEDDEDDAPEGDEKEPEDERPTSFDDAQAAFLKRRKKSGPAED